MPEPCSSSPLENLHIASPCHASWEAMSGDDKARFCKSCQKNVFNISLMSRQEAEALIQSREGNGDNLCVRYALREDGTVITNDCPVGLEKVKVVAWQSCQRPWRFFVAGITGIVAALCGAFGISTSLAQPPLDTPSRTQKTAPQLMGDIAPVTKTNQPKQAPPVLMGEMPAHSTKSKQAPVLMGRPAMPIKQPVNPSILQGGMAPPQVPTSAQCENPKAVPSTSQSRPTTIMVLGKIAIRPTATHKATPKTKAPTKKAGKKAPLKKIAKKR